jgi:hypothetical protein
MGMFINKIKLRKIINKLKLKSITKILKKNKFIPSAISGFKFKVGGRLLTQKSVPRKTVKLISSGSLSRSKCLFVETSRFTNKNKKGAFSLTVSIGQRLFSTSINPLYNNQIRSFQTSSIKSTYLTKSERESLSLNQK